METNNFNYVQSEQETAALSKTFMASVFSWMSAALIITGIVAYYFGTDVQLISMLRTVDPITGRYSHTILGFVVMFSPLALILVMGVGFRKLAYPVMLFLYLLFSMLMGASMSYIFLRYTDSSIMSVFFASSGMFGVMAFVGYTTNTDLTKFGSILMMALVGMIIASVINWFMQSESMSYIISFIGVLVFTGLTAYDVQKLKRIGAGLEYGTEENQSQ